MENIMIRVGDIEVLAWRLKLFFLINDKVIHWTNVYMENFL